MGKKRGPPEKYLECKERFLKKVEEVYYPCPAARLCYVHPDTIERWRRNHPEFKEDIKRAQDKFIERRLKRIDKAAEKGNWTADAWAVERARWEEWGKKDTYKHDVNFTQLPTNQQAKRMAEILIDHFGATVTLPDDIKDDDSK